MHNIKFIREHGELFDQALLRRNINIAEFGHRVILALDEEIRARKTSEQNLQQRRNFLAKELGRISAKMLKKPTPKDENVVAGFTPNSSAELENMEADFQSMKQESVEIKQLLDNMDYAKLEEELHNILSVIPNILDESVPNGVDENDNIVIKSWGVPRNFAEEGFIPLAHNELGVNSGLMDFANATKITGSRFVISYGDLAQLERAIANFMLDIHTQQHGYLEVSPPVLVNSDSMFGTGQLPKFKEDLFSVDKFYLIPTSEVSLTNIVRDRILNLNELPLRFVAYTNCFRSEAGAAGKDTAGMIRQHQFGKVELVSIVAEEMAEEEHLRKTLAAEKILELLELPYRRVLLCSGDTGFSASKTFDLEVWLPAQNKYREISSSSNCKNFQAFRLNAKYYASESHIKHVSTLNASGLAVGRTLVAILENYQKSDGSIEIPNILQKYMNGKSNIF